MSRRPETVSGAALGRLFAFLAAAPCYGPTLTAAGKDLRLLVLKAERRLEVHESGADSNSAQTESEAYRTSPHLSHFEREAQQSAVAELARVSI